MSSPFCVQYSISWTSSTCVHRNILWPECNFRGWEHISPSSCFRAHSSNQFPASRTNLSFLERQYHQSFTDVYLNGKNARCFSFIPRRFTIKLSVVCCWVYKVCLVGLVCSFYEQKRNSLILRVEMYHWKCCYPVAKKRWVYHQRCPLRFINCKLRLLHYKCRVFSFSAGY